MINLSITSNHQPQITFSSEIPPVELALFLHYFDSGKFAELLEHHLEQTLHPNQIDAIYSVVNELHNKMQNHDMLEQAKIAIFVEPSEDSKK